MLIMRGFPSTGKSYRAVRTGGLVLSTDDYWYQVNRPEKPREYSFDRQLLGKAHGWNQKRAREAVDSGEPLIVIDNTNTVASEFCCQYGVYAVANGYLLRIEEPTSSVWKEISPLLSDKEKNREELVRWAGVLAGLSAKTHNVPAHVIEQMMWRWECDLDADRVMEFCIKNHKKG